MFPPKSRSLLLVFFGGWGRGGWGRGTRDQITGCADRGYLWTPDFKSQQTKIPFNLPENFGGLLFLIFKGSDTFEIVWTKRT